MGTSAIRSTSNRYLSFSIQCFVFDHRLKWSRTFRRKHCRWSSRDVFSENLPGHWRRFCLRDWTRSQLGERIVSYSFLFSKHLILNATVILLQIGGTNGSGDRLSLRCLFNHQALLIVATHIDFFLDCFVVLSIENNKKWRWHPCPIRLTKQPQLCTTHAAPVSESLFVGDRADRFL